MTEFTFGDKASELYEPDEPDGGKYTFVFEHLPSGDRREVPGDGLHDAWKGIRYYEEEQWYEWLLIGFKSMLDREKPAYYRQTSANFRASNSELVSEWENSDSA